MFSANHIALPTQSNFIDSRNVLKDNGAEVRYISNVPLQPPQRKETEAQKLMRLHTLTIIDSNNSTLKNLATEVRESSNLLNRSLADLIIKLDNDGTGSSFDSGETENLTKINEVITASLTNVDASQSPKILEDIITSLKTTKEELDEITKQANSNNTSRSIEMAETLMEDLAKVLMTYRETLFGSGYEENSFYQDLKKISQGINIADHNYKLKPTTKSLYR
ncbi:MAG: hypothetical protein MK033_12515 [Candidatus Caenarcaniphilales bacterium]|nr:hypothetical protein [Candidatus Caenarcaniphilales bacterium]